MFIKHYQSKVKPLLQERKQVVHYFSLETFFRWSHIASRDSVLNKEMFIKKDNLAEIITIQLEACINGFELALELINELPSNTK